MIRISNIKVVPPFSEEKLRIAAAKRLGINPSLFVRLTIRKSSIDARKKADVFYLCTADITLPDETRYLGCKDVQPISSDEYEISPFANRYPNQALYAATHHPPVVVGSGPAGMMAALVLARVGLRPVVLERGKPVDARKRDVDSFRRTGILHTDSNVQFGEGGAGTFSDGKLTTGTHDPRIRFVLDTFTEHGAPEEIRYIAKPHIGTDHLIHMVQSIRTEILSLGGDYRFGHRLSALEIKESGLRAIRVTVDDFGDPDRYGTEYELTTNYLIVAIGHSARDTFDMLYHAGLQMQQKPFSAGVRIEHPQAMISRSQYGDFAGILPAADYKLSVHLPDGRGVYTFCMCPGGEVIAAASEDGCLVTNGMSYYARNLPNANSALLVGIGSEDFGSDHPLAGIAFQRQLERAAYQAGGGGFIAPAQRVGDFLHCRPTTAFGEVAPSYLPGVKGVDLTELMPQFLHQSMRAALPLFDRKLKGFAHPDAVMTGVETRSSSPVRILRNESLQSNISGIFPCGEGCGYAGGIMSAAVDGIRCAERILDMQ